MSVKMLHTSDFHLSNTSSVKIERSIKHVNVPVNIRTIDAFRKIRTTVEYAIEEGVKYFVIAGDVYDRPTQPMWLKRWFAKYVKMLLKNKIYTIILVGNHDSDGQISAFSDIKEMTFDSKYLYVIEKPCTKDIGSMRFHFVPYLTPDNITLKSAILHAKESRDFKKPNVLVGHFGVNGAIVGANEHVMESDIDPRMLAGFSYVALGDYHKYQKLGEGGLRKANEIFYAGSLQRINMSEPEKKGFNVVTFDSPTNLPIVGFQHIPDRQYLQFKTKYVNYKKMLKMLREGKKFKLGGKTIKKKSIVKLVITVTKEQKLTVSTKELNGLFKNIYGTEVVMVDYDIRKTKKDRVTGLNVHTDPEEYVKSYMKENAPPANVSPERAYNTMIKLLKEAQDD